MPSRSNPSSYNHRALTHKHAALACRSNAHRARSVLTEPIPKSYAGVVRGKTLSAKTIKKLQRNKNHALERKKEQMAKELLKAKGEVEMADATAVPPSKRQQKLAERRAKAEEHNWKARVGRDTMAVDTEESRDRAQVQAEIEMEVDI